MSEAYKSIKENSKDEDKEPLRIPKEERRIITMPYDYSIEVLNSQFNTGRLIIEDEGFQRKYVWDDKKSSGLIESLILNVPIPVCYFSEEESGIYSVIDGHQRITSIHRFIDNQFRLNGLKVITELNKLKFFELPQQTQRLLLNKTIRCIVLLQESHPELKFDIFERLNTGAVSLNAQELRNCIYRSALNDLVKELVKNPTWLKCLGTSGPHRRMVDRELVIRFFALSENWKKYKKPMKSFLNVFMRKGRKFNESKLVELKEKFVKTIGDVYYVFGSHSFRKFSANRWERSINRALYDVIMVAIADLESDTIRKNKNRILSVYKELQANIASDFSEYISVSTSDTKVLTERIRIFKEELSSLTGA